jgi:hypothetical protein
LILNKRGGPTVQFQVRYQGGRKQFDRLEGTDPIVSARAFAAAQREDGKGWAEIARITTEIVERKR